MKENLVDTTKVAEQLREAVKQLDRPRSSIHRRPRDCKQHTFIVSDRCDHCGTPMPVPDEKG